MMLILQLDTEFHSRLFGFDKNADENMGEFYFSVGKQEENLFKYFLSFPGECFVRCDPKQSVFK